MPDHVATQGVRVEISGGGRASANDTMFIEPSTSVTSVTGSYNDDEGNNDGTWSFGETIIDNDGGTYTPLAFANPANNGTFQVQFVGTVTHGGFDYPVVYLGAGDTHYVLFNDNPGVTASAAANSFFTTFGSGMNSSLTFTLDSSDFTECFAEGTRITTSIGDKKVEDLQIGDTIRTADGGTTKVLWVGHQTIFPALAGEKDQPVRIRAGALGENLPTQDLIVTADHALYLDGLLVNAAALVDHREIDFVPSSELPQLRVYHVETEAHEVILANGCPAESYLPTQDRSSFANYQEYLELYGAARLVREMDIPRLSTRRLIPQSILNRITKRAVQTQTSAVA